MLRKRAMIERTARKNLIKIAKAYAKATGTTLSAVSRKFYGKHGFLADFAKGKQSITLSNIERMVKAFSKSWPAGAAWPETEPILMSRPAEKIIPKI